MANRILLLVKCLLFLLGNVATILLGHIPLFMTDHLVIFTESFRFSLRDFSFFNFLFNPLILFFQTLPYQMPAYHSYPWSSQ